MEEMKIEIPCNRKVREYTTRQVKALTGLTVSRAYELMRETGSLPVAESSNIMKRGKQLLKLIDSFKFPSSIPVRPVDDRHMWQFRERWVKYLQEQLNKVVGSSKPVYLVDEVNKQLKRRKSNITCIRIHLMWYLDVYGEDNMTPESIATAIIKFGVSDWSQVQPLVNNSKYSLSLAGGADNVDQEVFAQTIEFIWSVPKPKIQDDILAKLDNDIKVVQEFCKLWESAPTTYDYKKVIESYISRLQTIPPSKKRVSLNKDCSKIGQAVEQEQQTAINTQEHSEVETDIHKYRYASTLEYLMVKAGNDETAKLRIREKDAFIRAFCQLNDFDKYFQDVKEACEHPEVTYKASNALGLIEKYVRIKGVIIR